MTAIQDQSRVGDWEQREGERVRERKRERERERERERGEVGDGRGPSNF